jgi:hypothetical protein
LLEASGAPPSVDVLEDGSGDRVRVERGPGWLRAVLERSAEYEGTELWRSPALEQRPPGLPGHVPFLPGAPGLAVFSGATSVALWPWRDDRAASLDQARADPLAATSLDSLAGVLALEGTPPGTAAAVPGGDGPLGPLATLGWGAGAQEALLGEGLERLVEESLAQGWTLEEERLSGPPFPARELRLAKADRLRLLTLSSAGTGAEVVLLDLPGGR